MRFRIALAAPNRIVHAQDLATRAHGRLDRVASGKPASLNVLFTNRFSPEPANCPDFILTLDTSHMRAPLPSNL
jgi:hypothetical protein